VFIFDNATTHLKWVDNALSTHKMPKKMPRHGRNWGVEVAVLDGDGKQVFGPNGKVQCQKVCMGDATFADGRLQRLHFPKEHPDSPSVFKGIAVILEERGYSASELRVECKGFKCPKNATTCCCQRMLYNELDFADDESLLETTCKARGFQVLFLPKFHCELNFIEQCWGYSKRKYRECPISSKEVDLERNVLTALDSVLLASMRRFATRSWCFMDGYRRGLNGKQAAWASKKYWGHRVLPDTIFQEIELDLVD